MCKDMNTVSQRAPLFSKRWFGLDPSTEMGAKTAICAKCRCDTGISIEIPPAVRKYYIPKVGQFCDACYAEVKPLV